MKLFENIFLNLLDARPENRIILTSSQIELNLYFNKSFYLLKLLINKIKTVSSSEHTRIINNIITIDAEILNYTLSYLLFSFILFNVEFFNK